MLCKLTEQEIRKLTHSKSRTTGEYGPRKGVKVHAVENFLGTVTANPNASAARTNARMDAQSYGWNAATVNAINKGILLAAKKCK